MPEKKTKIKKNFDIGLMTGANIGTLQSVLKRYGNSITCESRFKVRKQPSSKRLLIITERRNQVNMLSSGLSTGSSDTHLISASFDVRYSFSTFTQLSLSSELQSIVNIKYVKSGQVMKISYFRGVTIPRYCVVTRFLGIHNIVYTMYPRKIRIIVYVLRQ